MNLNSLSRRFFPLFATVFLLQILSVPAVAKPSKIPDWAQKITWRGKHILVVKDELIVKFKPVVAEFKIKNILKKKGLKIKKYIGLIDVYLIKLRKENQYEALVEELKGSDPTFLVQLM